MMEIMLNLQIKHQTTNDAITSTTSSRLTKKNCFLSWPYWINIRSGSDISGQGLSLNHVIAQVLHNMQQTIVSVVPDGDGRGTGNDNWLIMDE